MEAKVILTKGLPGSGKSTWAKEQMHQCPGCYKRVNKDDIRGMLDDGVYSPENEELVRNVRDAAILLAMHAGYVVIVDDTNINPTHVQQIQALVLGQAEAEIQDFTNVPLEVCIERDRNRPNPVGEQAIRRMAKYLEEGAGGIGGRGLDRDGWSL